MRGKTILPSFRGAHVLAVQILNKMKINIHFETPYSDGTDVKIPASEEVYKCIIDCRGFKYLGPSKYMTGDLAQCLDKKSGQILVNNFC